MIGNLVCQDITVADMQAVVNAAPNAGEGARLQRCISALVFAGITGGYLASPRLKQVHWQAWRLALPRAGHGGRGRVHAVRGPR